MCVSYFLQAFYATIQTVTSTWIAMKIPGDYRIVPKKHIHANTRTSHQPRHKFVNFNWHRLIIFRWPRAWLVLFIAFHIGALEQWRNQIIIWTVMQLIIWAEISTLSETKKPSCFVCSYSYYSSFRFSSVAAQFYQSIANQSIDFDGMR